MRRERSGLPCLQAESCRRFGALVRTRVAKEGWPFAVCFLKAEKCAQGIFRTMEKQESGPSGWKKGRGGSGPGRMDGRMGRLSGPEGPPWSECDRSRGGRVVTVRAGGDSPGIGGAAKRRGSGADGRRMPRATDVVPGRQEGSGQVRGSVTCSTRRRGSRQRCDRGGFPAVRACSARRRADGEGSG